MLSMKSVEQKVTVYGPKGIKKYLNGVFESTQLFLKYPFEIIEMEETKAHHLGEMMEGIAVSAHPLVHRYPNFFFFFNLTNFFKIFFFFFFF